MGLFEKLFGKSEQPKPQKVDGKFKLLTAYEPVYTSWSGSLYESELVRSAIDARARHISKLRVEIQGAAKPKLQIRMKRSPNDFQTWSQFLYRLSTILDMQNTAFIVPVFGEFGEIIGVYPVLPTRCEVISVEGEPWIRYRFNNGQTAAIELYLIGIMTKFQYKSDFFGESNAALLDTMSLIKLQRDGIKDATKNSNTYKFWAQVSNFTKTEDLAKERKRFTSQNLTADADSEGLLLFPNTYTNITKLDSKSFVVDEGQMKLIQTNVYNYYGVNERILQNLANGDEWAAFYEGCVEVFAIQFSEVMTRMLFTPREQSQGSLLMATANRLQYMSNADKLNVAAQLTDRGILSINEAREIFNLMPVDGGDIRTIRGEYKDANDLNNGGNEDERE
jgi:hypothetical protein